MTLRLSAILACILIFSTCSEYDSFTNSPDFELENQDSNSPHKLVQGLLEDDYPSVISLLRTIIQVNSDLEKDTPAPKLWEQMKSDAVWEEGIAWKNSAGEFSIGVPIQTEDKIDGILIWNSANSRNLAIYPIEMIKARVSNVGKVVDNYTFIAYVTLASLDIASSQFRYPEIHKYLYDIASSNSSYEATAKSSTIIEPFQTFEVVSNRNGGYGLTADGRVTTGWRSTMLACWDSGGGGHSIEDTYHFALSDDIFESRGSGGSGRRYTTTRNQDTTNTLVNRVPTAYPCIFDVVNNTLNDILSNQDLLKPGVGEESYGTLFGPESGNSITFEVGNIGTDWGQTKLNLDRHKLTEGYPNYHATITLSTNLANCSKDAIYATILHELQHASISLNRQRMVVANADIHSFLTKYPSFSESSSRSPVLRAYSIASHNTMANSKFRDVMALQLRMRNPHLGWEQAIHLSWAGLQSTDNWKKLSPDLQNQIGLTNQASICNKHDEDQTQYRFNNC